MTAPRWLPAAAAAFFATGLAWLNRGERVAIDVGLTTFYRAPLAIVLLLVFLAGMLAMLLLSLRHDRRVRDELRRHGLLQPEPPVAQAASAWGATAPREDGARTVVPLEEDHRAAYVADAGHTAAHVGDGDRTVSRPRDHEQTAAFPRYDEDPAA